MSVVLYRIDERLIHGQVMVSWLGQTGATEIVIVDEVLAKDDFLQQIFQLAAPSNVKVEVVGVSEFGRMNFKNKTIVLFKGPEQALAALNFAIEPQELIVGNVATAPGRVRYTKYAYLSAEEKEMLASLQRSGWKVTLQLLPNGNKVDFKNN